jgi:hypothetical protein
MIVKNIKNKNWLWWLHVNVLIHWKLHWDNLMRNMLLMCKVKKLVVEVEMELWLQIIDLYGDYENF